MIVSENKSKVQIFYLDRELEKLNWFSWNGIQQGVTITLQKSQKDPTG